jgi:hypothetical protein
MERVRVSRFCKEVVSCVVRAFDALSFPESRDSAITVVYPLTFSPTASR